MRFRPSLLLLSALLLPLLADATQRNAFPAARGEKVTWAYFYMLQPHVTVEEMLSRLGEQEVREQLRMMLMRQTPATREARSR